MSLSSDPPLYGGVGPASGGHAAAVPPPSSERGLSAPRDEPSTADVAKDQAAEVAGTARDAGKHVAGVAGEQAGQVASEATQQVKALVAQTRDELAEQAAEQQKRVATGLRSLSEELGAMARGSEQSGMATDLVHQASDRTNAVASWLEQREPGHVLEEVTRFARQRPGTFLALAAGAGLLVGRLGRGLKEANDDDGDDGAGSRGATTSPGSQWEDANRQGFPAAPQPPAATYPPTPRYGTGYGHQAAPGGYQQPPAAPSYPPQAPAYSQQAPAYPQPQAPAYPQPQAPAYPSPPSQPPRAAPGYSQGPGTGDSNP